MYHAPRWRAADFCTVKEKLRRFAGGKPLVNVVDKAKGY
jgi:hypothetical protein